MADGGFGGEVKRGEASHSLIWTSVMSRDEDFLLRDVGAIS
jgi:hypothetical protein